MGRMWGRGGGDGRAEEEAPRRRLPTGRSGISERDGFQGDDLNSSGGHRSPEVSRRSTEMTLKNKKDENKRKKERALWTFHNLIHSRSRFIKRFHKMTPAPPKNPLH
jgi:hypothetical protein